MFTYTMINESINLDSCVFRNAIASFPKASSSHSAVSQPILNKYCDRQTIFFIYLMRSDKRGRLCPGTGSPWRKKRKRVFDGTNCPKIYFPFRN